MRVFVSYRRDDVGGYAGRLADALSQRLGARSLFQDVTAIGAGRDFGQAIDHALDDCDAVLVVIGPGWLSASTPEGRPRLHEPDDYVRLEVARALQRQVRVVPVLAGGAGLPPADQLPDDLRDLVRRQAVTLHNESWHEDVDGLQRSLQGRSARPSRRRPVLAAVAVAVVVALVGGLGGGAAGRRTRTTPKPPPPTRRRASRPPAPAGRPSPWAPPPGWTRVPRTSWRSSP